MTDALLRLGYHLRFGKIDPQSLFPDMGLKQTGADVDIIKTGQEAIDTAQIPAWLETLRPHKPLLCGPQESPGRLPGRLPPRVAGPPSRPGRCSRKAARTAACRPCGSAWP